DQTCAVPRDWGCTSAHRQSRCRVHRRKLCSRRLRAERAPESQKLHVKGYWRPEPGVFVLLLLLVLSPFFEVLAGLVLSATFGRHALLPTRGSLFQVRAIDLT